jgi:myosin heavy subunit
MAAAVEKLGPKHPDWKYLQQSMEQRMKDQSKPFDAKTDVWVKHDKEMFIMAKITSEKGDKVSVNTAEGNSLDVPKAEAYPQNPSKFFQAEDMSDLSHLNDASVLYNLRSRYDVLMIYTYSGLFCIAINPYKLLPVYTQIARDFYVNKRRNEAPPHLYSIADGAYQNMRLERKNQSMLITGESGAGKTENTKRVLQFYALTAADPNAIKSAGDAKGGSLEDQIVQANPPLEAYGNAKTVRNNNSSRFGKFIRIHFGAKGKIAAADIETYLLEKSRVTFQLEIERNYHIFYQFLSPKFPDYQKQCLVEPKPEQYFFINQGKLTVDGMDDAFEMGATEEAFDILGFSPEEKVNCYKITNAVMWSGNAKFKQKGREEQGECDGDTEVSNVATLLGLDVEEYIETLLKPKLKVGKDYVRKGQNKEQILFSVAATAKSTYARLFDWIVEKVNKTLDTPNPREYFIGVLDIAGFEIFELNTLEQLLINYTNERLQQFFNHHMFVLEQETYKAEGIVWAFIDFGMDLEKTIELIEKKMGILAILEEECIVPKATDKTLLDKMMTKHLGKHNSFGKPKPAKKGKPESHFQIHHYAGTVGYNVTGWLFKNKDPINEAMVAIMLASKNPLTVYLFTEKDTGTKKKGGSMATISAGHRESLLKLMDNLNSTHPHFVRCIIPNEIKKSGWIDAGLVMHQLTCNGVLEGIRICSKGFPNKLEYPAFKPRYSIVAPWEAANIEDDKEAANKMLTKAGLVDPQFKCGLTKIFFQAGVLSKLEEVREEALTKIIVKMQCHCRKALVQVHYKVKRDEKLYLGKMQHNIRMYLRNKEWGWMKLHTLISGEMSKLKKKKEEEERAKKLAAGMDKIKGQLRAEEDGKAQAEMENKAKRAELDGILNALDAEKSQSGEIMTRIEQSEQRLLEVSAQHDEFQKKLEEERENMKRQLKEAKDKMEEQKKEMQRAMQEMRDRTHGNGMSHQTLKNKAISLESEKEALKGEIGSISEEIAKLDKKAQVLLVEKKDIWNAIGDLQIAVTNEITRGCHIAKEKTEMQYYIANERRIKEMKSFGICEVKEEAA